MTQKIVGDSGTWITRAEAAALLNRTERQMQRYASAGKLKPHSRRDPASKQLRIYYRRSQVLTLAKTVKPLSARALYLRTLETSLGIATNLVHTSQEILNELVLESVGYETEMQQHQKDIDRLESELEAVRATIQTELKPLLPKGKRGKQNTEAE